MRVVVNEKYIQGKARLGTYATVGGLIVLVLAMGIAWINPDPMSIAFAYICLPFGLILSQIGNYHRLRWARHPREDEIIAQSLKGLDRDYRLLSYLPGLPSHVLLTPGSVYVIEPRYNTGKVVVRGQKYRGAFSPLAIFGGGAEGKLGNPAADAWRGAEVVKQLVEQRLGDGATAIPVQPLVLFLNNNVSLDVADAAVPNLTPRDIKSFLRKSQAKEKLSAAEQAEIRAALVGELGSSIG